jgi:beta-lactam-binding protein with PASTA domain
VVVPNIVGQSYWVAEATLAPDLLIGIDRWVCSDIYLIPNTVITQDPAAGTTAYVGDTVDVVLSTGACAPGVVTVPSIVGQTFWEAQATLAPDLLINITKWVCSDIYLVPNTVVTQDPTAGVVVDEGSTVNVTLSYAPCTPPADLSDVSITSVQIPASLARIGAVKTLSVTVTNDATAAGAGTGTVRLAGTDGSVFTGSFTNLAPGASQAFSWNWTVPSSQTVVWAINVTVNGVVVDSATRTTQIR